MSKESAVVTSRKKSMKRNPAAEQVASIIYNAYQPKTAEEMLSALKDAFAPLFEQVLQAEMTAHLGYEKSQAGEKQTENRRNGYTEKKVKSSIGEISLQVPRDRDGTFEPVLLPKYKRDISEFEYKVLAMYARGMSYRDIAITIEDIYGFKLSPEKISSITDSIIDDVKEWRNRQLQEIYSFIFVDCIYATVRDDHNSKAKQQAIYIILGIDLDCHRDILGIWINPTESKSCWMNIFDNIKQRGVKDILFLSMDGVSGLEEGVKTIFPQTVVQRCIVHLMRNSLKYVSQKDYKDFCASIKKVYTAVSEEECRDEFNNFETMWSKKCPGAVKVWKSHFDHIIQLFDFPTEIRRIMYTTNAIESVNSSLRKVTKKGSFDSPDALLKVF